MRAEALPFGDRSGYRRSVVSKPKRPQEHGQGQGTVTVGGRDAFAIRTRSVVYDANAKTAELKVDIAELREAERTFIADGAFVRIRHGHPEVVVVQLDPFDDGRIARAVVARFDGARFVDRARQSGEFRDKFDEYFRANPRRTKQGYFKDLLAKARSTEATTSALIHAQIELSGFNGPLGFVVIATLPGAVARAIIANDLSKVRFHAEVECVMSTEALADLFFAWEDVAKQLAK